MIKQVEMSFSGQKIFKLLSRLIKNQICLIFLAKIFVEECYQELGEKNRRNNRIYSRFKDDLFKTMKNFRSKLIAKISSSVVFSNRDFL